MTLLRRRMIEDMTLCNLARKAAETSVSSQLIGGPADITFFIEGRVR